MWINLQIFRLFTHISISQWPSSHHNIQCYRSPHFTHNTKYVRYGCHSEAILEGPLHFVWIRQILISTSILSTPRPHLQCLSVQWSLLSVGPLGLACRRVSLQHHHRPLPPLYRPRQPLFPSPPSHAAGDTGAQWNRAHCSGGVVVQCLIQCLCRGWVKLYEAGTFYWDL